MKQIVHNEVTIKVKPVVRHVVTKSESTTWSDGGTGGSAGTICEVASESAANEIARALELLHAPRRYVVVQRTFEPENNIVYYADTRDQAEQFKGVLQKFHRTDFRIFEEPILDPRERPIPVTGEPTAFLMDIGDRMVMTHVAPTSETNKDHRRVFRIEVPDGASQAEAVEAVRKAFAQKDEGVSVRG